MEVNKSFENSAFNSKLTYNSKQVGEEINIRIKKEVDIIEGCVYESQITIETDPIDSILYQESQFQEKYFECSICGYLFLSNSSLKCHIKTHSEEKLYSCKVYDKSHYSLSVLQNHIQVHSNVRLYKCNICEKTFSRKQNLNTHKFTHTGEKPYNCGECKWAFTDLGALKKHKKVHTGEKPYKCDICKKLFTNKYNLKTHQRIHTGEKPYECKFCNKTFSQSSHLKSHLRIHSGEKPYNCGECKKKFTVSSALKTHKKVHTGEKPYKCDICKKSFTNKYNLKTHQRIHTGEKPYECFICKKTFSLKKTLRTHMGEEPYKCNNICKNDYGAGPQNVEKRARKTRNSHRPAPVGVVEVAAVANLGIVQLNSTFFSSVFRVPRLLHGHRTLRYRSITMKISSQSYAILWLSIMMVIWRAVVSEKINKYSEIEAAKYLDSTNQALAQWTNRIIHADWNWLTNLTNENAEKKLAINLEFGNFLKTTWKETVKFPWSTYTNADIKRQFKLLSVLGTAALPEDKMKKLDATVATMESLYGKATIPEYGDNNSNRTLSLEPDINDILHKSYDVNELKHVWIKWREATGKKVRSMYAEYVKLSNEAARLNNYTDAADFWIRGYEVDDFRPQMEKLWTQIKPLYLQIHAYVRRKLWEQYGSSVVTRTGPIPAHLLGDMWAQTWGRVDDFTRPYPTIDEVNPTTTMINQNYTPKKMFKIAEEFFTSLNLSAMPQSFWDKSILEKPYGRELVCHASAWDFYDSKDFRIKQCTSVNFIDFITAHHEMGHIQYYLQYKDQPFIYRDGANEGFHEAIGDTISLSVSTPKHMNKIGLLPKPSRSYEANINYLYQMGLDKIVFLPFGYLIDLWRWDVFKGRTTEENYNCDWWKLRYSYQGVEPPVTRNENDFDPGSKYHIVGNVPYIRYFVSYIIQFQFHQALCEKAGQFDPSNPKSKPLHECDIYQSTNAGNAFKEMLKLGSSKPWFEAMELLTGQREMDAGPLLNYFNPLYEWLKNENKKTGEQLGWEAAKKICVPTSDIQA
ncbi:Zinc finger C2H2-type,Peptidase M2, peptidyl-dipeptidase A [Cinara cedri]|uniref:Angiotensin-converting enzyme n=1 Tax=Cinara cedri TaxID=506608 RepID=A0A5E4NPW7_9HEMI|nr:Zinc finger C2H2-type,Peptidase M2, peptidyl-dipeptidase A [Cinara cedri]